MKFVGKPKMHFLHLSNLAGNAKAIPLESFFLNFSQCLPRLVKRLFTANYNQNNAVLQIKTFACRIILGHTHLNKDTFLFCLSNMFEKSIFLNNF